ADQAGEDLEDGRLARAVGTEEAVDRAGGHVERQVGDRRHGLVVLCQPGRRDGCCCGHGFVAPVLASYPARVITSLGPWGCRVVGRRGPTPPPRPGGGGGGGASPPRGV